MTHANFKGKPFAATFNSLVDDLFTELPAFVNKNCNDFETKASVPVNVKETASEYVLEVIAPGYEKTDFKIQLDQKLLTVSADKKDETTSEKDKQIRKEFTQRSFKRSFTIDEKIDATNIGASYLNGVLVLTLPKKELVKQAATEIVIK